MCDEKRPIVGIGVDMCAISRMERAIEKEHFCSRVFTPQERAYFDAKKKGRAQSAAAMYAAKEAVAKAFGTGIAEGVFFDQIEVVHLESGAPQICLHGESKRRLEAMGGTRTHLSLSHEGDMAIAFVILEG